MFSGDVQHKPNKTLCFPGLETLCVHAGRMRPPSGLVSSPLTLYTNFVDQGDRPDGKLYSYSTFDNPNRREVEQAFAELEGGACAVASASGMAAIAGVVAALPPSSRVLAHSGLFQRWVRLLLDQAARWGVETAIVDAPLHDLAPGDFRGFELVWIDTPSNPLLQVTDIGAVVVCALHGDVLVSADNTLATFLLQRPIELGCDVVAYSFTNVVGSHGDAVCGIAIFAKEGEWDERARAFRRDAGAVKDPSGCRLIHRGPTMLSLRLKPQSESGAALATLLDANPGVVEVFYPSSGRNRGSGEAGFGGILSFRPAGGRIRAGEVVRRLRLFTLAPSLGGAESLAEHRAFSPIQTTGSRLASVPDDLIRLSIGLECAEDLISDLSQVLSQ